MSAVPYFALMAAVYIAPSLSPTGRIVVSGLCLLASLIAAIAGLA
jgi:hypothetical protein